jgi:autotransporter-associated beta strand protein
VLVGNNNALGAGFVQVQFSIPGTKTIASASSTGYTITNNINVFNDLNLGLASVNTGSLNFSGTFYLGDEVGQNRIITTAAGTAHVVSGAVTGNRGIVKQGAGTITLSGANTSTGGLYIDNGTINLNGGSIAFSVIDIGSGDGAGTQTGNNSTLRVTSGTFTQPITVNNEGATPGNRTIEFANATGSATLSGAITAEKTFAANVAAGAATGVLSGAISGAGGLTKTGDGTLTLSGGSANTYSGTTTVSAGVLNLNKSVSNAVNGNLVVGSGTTDSSVKLLLSSSNQVGSGSGQTVTLSGGTIARGGNVSEVFGNLNLTAASFLDYGASNDVGTIRFGTYTPSSLLTVQNFLPGSRLQFGNTISSTDLNNGTLFSFSNGFTTSTEDGFFTITAIPEPSTYLAAAGLLALFLWPARRRLLKDSKSILGLRAAGRDRIEAYRQA